MSRAYQHGDLTLVYPITRSTPAFLPLIAVPLIGESISVGGAIVVPSGATVYGRIKEARAARRIRGRVTVES